MDLEAFVKSIVTDSLAMLNDMIPGMNTIKIHLIAFDVFSKLRY